jgi:hypothetical protein
MIDTDKLKKLIDKKSAELSKPSPQGQSHNTQTKDAENKFRRDRDKMKEDIEIVADILFNEGYVDSQESLNVILSVMSEEFIMEVAQNYRNGYFDFKGGNLDSGSTPQGKLTRKALKLIDSPKLKDRQRANKMDRVLKSLTHQPELNKKNGLKNSANSIAYTNR